MHLLKANRVGRSWRLRATQAPRGSEVIPRPEDASKMGRQTILAWRSTLVADGESEAACVEFPKAAIGEGELSVGYAEWVAGRCANGSEDQLVITAPRTWLSRRSVSMAMRARGLRLVRGANWSLLDALSMLVAGLVACCGLLAHGLVYASRTRDVPAGAWWLAVQGEWSNRTRHVLREAVSKDMPAAILVLGRPGCRLSDLEVEWKSRLGVETLPILVRPWSLACLLRSLPSACGATAAAMRIARSAPYLPAFRERIGMLYRMYLGFASARWWQRQAQRSGCVVYGHTGNADTTLLELAQHATGQATWHVVHGMSAGLNFTGRSSVAVFTCAHDARWHRHLGGYGRCLHLPVPMPTLVSGESGLLLLTNYAHPMNVDCRVSGTSAEEEVLQAVSLAAAQLGEVELQWRPHPALATLDPAQQFALRGVARSLGFRELPAAHDWLEEARNSRWVVTTASTVVVQLLEAGVVPVVLVPAWLDPDCALARYPLAVREPGSLPDVLSRLEFGSRYRREMLEAAWQTIGPGRLANPSDWTE